jgi:hypothetical protein
MQDRKISHLFYNNYGCGTHWLLLYITILPEFPTVSYLAARHNLNFEFF